MIILENVLNCECRSLSNYGTSKTVVDNIFLFFLFLSTESIYYYHFKYVIQFNTLQCNIGSL